MKYTEILEDGKLPYWWRWQNFTPKEVSCKHCGEIWREEFAQVWDPKLRELVRTTVPPQWFLDAMDTLQLLRTQWGKPIIINSGHRCAYHNREVGGVADSQHYTHIAFDCRCPKDQQKKFASVAQNAGFLFTLKYPDRGFVHVDLRIGK